jgi:hypothetical protein
MTGTYARWVYGTTRCQYMYGAGRDKPTVTAIGQDLSAHISWF